MWQTAQVWVPGFGMWPAGSVVGVVQLVVVWQIEQSPVAWLADWCADDVIRRPPLQRRRRRAQ